MRKYNRDEDDYLLKAKDNIKSLDEITLNNINNCLGWEKSLHDELSNEIAIFRKQLEDTEKEIQELYNSRETAKRRELYEKRSKLIELIEIPRLLEITETEKNLIDNKVLFITGEAGVGKSQLFANASKKNIDSGGFSLLMLGQSFITSDSIFDQVINKLNVEQNFDEFLLILESIGELNNKCITIFFDAINESSNREVWKQNMNELIIKVSNHQFLRLAFSLRNGYENSLQDESVKSKIKKERNFCSESYGL